MTDYTKQKIKECLKDYLIEISRQGKNGLFYNPTNTGDTKASLSILDGTTFKDFGYSGVGLEKGDIFTLYAYMNGLDVKTDFIKVATALAEHFNILIDDDTKKNTANRVKQQIVQQQEQKPQTNYSDYYKKCIAELEEHQEAQDYLKGRCIAANLIKKYGIGYDAEKKQIIIPCSDYYFKGRSIDDKAYIKHANPKDAKVSLWNSEALKDSTITTAIYITESITDSLTLETASPDIKTIALNSTSNARLLYDAIKQYDFKGYFVLCLDADETGIKASEELHKELDKQNIFSYIYNTDDKAYGGEWKKTENDNELALTIKDLNELAIKTKESEAFIKSFVNINIIEDSEEAFKKYLLQDLKPTTEYITELEEEIKHSDTYKPTSTNIKILDDALNGGFYAKQIITLVAGTSLGKTGLALQIADAIAENKPVLYFSLEMSQSELIARSISRFIGEQIDNEDLQTYSMNQLDILQGKHYNNAKYMGLYLEARNKYIESVKDNLFIYEGLGDKENTITEIENKINKYIAKTQQKPVVFIDYLQYIDADEPHATDKQATDKIIRVLKKTARKQAISIFVISSTARGKDKKELEIDSGKNSGDIEYTSDILLAINDNSVEDAKTDSKGNLKQEEKKKQKQARKQHTRDIYLSVLKNRNGRRDIDIKDIAYTPSINFYDFKKAHIE